MRKLKMKNSKMKNGIQERGRNSYLVVVSRGKDPDTGKYQYVWETVRGSKTDAKNRRAELIHQLNKGNYIKPAKTTLAEYLERWLEDYCKPNVAPQTAQTYDFFIHKQIIPSIGKIPLVSLSPERIQRLYVEKLSNGRRDGKGGLGGRSVRYIHVTLHTALKNAVKIGMISRNPADAVDAPRVKSHEMQIMNESDIHIFLEYAKSTEYYPLFYLALFSGMRRSEILALKWSDVDLLLCQLSVSKTLHQLHNGEIIFSEPKTVKGRRLIALSPSTALVLHEHRQQQEELKRSLGLKLAEDDLVFSQVDGKPLLPDSVSKAWRNLSKRVGLQEIRLHDARHTHASLMLKQGIHPKVVQERLGHASISITLDTYSHVVPGLQQEQHNALMKSSLTDKKSRLHK